MYKKYEILEFSKFWNFRRRVWLDACASGHAEPIFGRLGHTWAIATALVVPGLSKQQIIIFYIFVKVGNLSAQRQSIL